MSYDPGPEAAALERLHPTGGLSIFDGRDTGTTPCPPSSRTSAVGIAVFQSAFALVT